jgi:hypothetical protein
VKLHAAPSKKKTRIFVALFLTLGLPLAARGAIGAAGECLLRLHGTEGEATITGRDRSIARFGGVTHYVEYEFRTPRGDVASPWKVLWWSGVPVSPESWKRAKDGQSIRILYVVQAPELNRPVHSKEAATRPMWDLARAAVLLTLALLPRYIARRRERST